MRALCIWGRNMADPFQSHSSGLSSPATRHFTITPANSDLSIRPRSLFVTVTGDVVVRDEGGTDITYAAVPAYTEIPIRAMQVRTGTTATVVGLY